MKKLFRIFQAVPGYPVQHESFPIMLRLAPILPKGNWFNTEADAEDTLEDMLTQFPGLKDQDFMILPVYTNAAF